MQIQPINVNYLSKTNNQPSFGKTYPVIHWLSEEGGKQYAPVVTEELTKLLQSKLVRRFNKPLTGLKADKLDVIQRIQGFLFRNDSDYRQHKVTRSFYDEKGGWENNKFNPISYMMTGIDAFSFEQSFGKPIGQIRKKSPRVVSGKHRSAELLISQKDYYEKGLKFVKEKSELAKNPLGENVSLHTKFIIHRTKSGKIKDYELVGMKFCPNNGPENPFVKLGYIKE